MANTISSLKGGIIASVVVLIVIALATGTAAYFGLKHEVDSTLIGALAGASVAAILSIILNIFPAIWLVPSIESRKHWSIQEEIIRSEIASDLAGLVSSLEYLIGFDSFKRGRIIPTHQYTLTRQLNYAIASANSLRKNVERLPIIRNHPKYDSKVMQKVFIELGGVADKTKENVEAGSVKEFTGRNRTALKDKYNAIIKFKELYESL